MNALAIARVLHVLGVVIWIGGVSMVTTTLLSPRAFASDEARVAAFKAVERRFVRQARWLVLLVGGSGLYMLYGFDAWSRFRFAEYWWMHAMVCLWLIFAGMLFVVEPLSHRRKQRLTDAERARKLRRMQIMHWIMLILSLITVAGAVAGSHGGWTI